MNVTASEASETVVLLDLYYVGDSWGYPSGIHGSPGLYLGMVRWTM